MNFFRNLTPLGKIILIVAILGSVAGILYVFDVNPLPERKTVASLVPNSVDMPDAEVNPTVVPAGFSTVALPDTRPVARRTDREIRHLDMAWTAQLGKYFANGGPITTRDSFMNKHGVYLKIERQDDTMQMMNELVKFATEYCTNGGNPTVGSHFITVMGDGAAQYIAAMNQQLKKLGDDCTAEIAGAIGFSDGEDTFMGPVEWKDDPEQALGKNTIRGGLVAAYLRDGDWNLLVYWANNNGLKVNPDDRTWDPDAINVLNPKDFLDAVDKYVGDYCEERPVVENGKRTRETKRVCVEAVATWEPGSANAVTKKGGLVHIFTTKDNRWQMPATLIGIKRWNADHAELVAHMLAAAGEGGDQVKYNPEAKRFAAEVATKIYKDRTAQDWLDFYQGSQRRDKQTGEMIQVGGSRAIGLGDALFYFGLTDGGDNLYRYPYEGFGNIVKTMYPEIMPEVPPLDEVLNVRYMRMASEMTRTIAPDKPVFASDQQVTEVAAARSWKINFATGSARLAPGAERTLEELLQQVAMGTLLVEIHGHTDDTGTPEGNDALSLARAETVRQWLQQKSRASFSDGRVRVEGHGQRRPLADNRTESGRSQNRRVEIRLGRS